MNKLVESKPQFDSCYTRIRCGAAALTVGQGCQVCAQKCFDWFTVWAKSMLHTVWNKKINTVFFTIAFRTSSPFLSAFSRCIATPFRRREVERDGGSGWEDVRHLVCCGTLSMQLTQSVQTPALCPYILFQQNFSFHSQRVRASLAAKELLKWQICTVMLASSSSSSNQTWGRGWRGREKVVGRWVAVY